MYDRAMAQGRIDDLVRAADRERLVRSTRVGRAGERAARRRRVASTVLHAVLWPVRH
jgi:hypothetical protein